MSVKEHYPNICMLLKLWGIGGYQSELSDSAKIREHVQDTQNSYVEELISEFSTAIQNVDSIYKELGEETFRSFESRRQCLARLQPLLNELVVVRSERYRKKGS